MFGRMWITNLETNEIKTISKNEKIPEGWIKGRKENITTKRRKQISDAVKSRPKFIWIRRIDKSEHKQMLADKPIPEGWERGACPKFTDESKNRLRKHFENERPEKIQKQKTYLEPIYKEYLELSVYGNRKNVFNLLKEKYNIKGSWQNFLGLCKKYLENYRS